MKAALKFIMTAVGLLLIGLFLAVVLLLTQFEEYLRDGLTHQAGRILQCEVHLEAVRLDWVEQALVFKGISIFNPESFTDREAVAIGSMTIKPDALTLFSRTPGIAQLALQDVQLHLQYKAGSGTNLGTLMDYARDWAEKQEAAEKTVWGRRLKLREIQSDEVAVKAEGLLPPTPVISLTMPPFSVEDPGGGAAITGAKAMHLVLRGLMREGRRVDGIVQPLKDLLG
ncbi:MAG: hypothetical protein L3K26_04745 [Candidatus Hydrogenedentes bacterium]|nr:hypothetical protein [Candidatus Hydrogenedentota bacterium]